MYKMDNNQLQKIQELENKNQELIKKLDELSNKFDELKGVVNAHTHGGLDGSKQFYNDPIILKSGIGISSGKYQFIDSETSSSILGGLVVGDGAVGSGIVDHILNTSQLTIDHQPSTNGTTNQTFYYGYRSPVYSAEDNGSITSGGTTMSQTRFSWTTDELDGAYVLVTDTANPTQFDAYEIASNTTTTLTITGGTWTFTDTSADFTIFMPIYFGSAEFPWRRLYTTDGITGGIRFGMGDTNGSQNALLYTDGTNLKFRKKDGTETTVTVV